MNYCRIRLREEIDETLNRLDNYSAECEEYSAIVKNLQTLCDIEINYDRLAQDEIQNEKTRKQEKKNYITRLAVESGLDVFGKMLNSIWLLKGYQIETTGSMTVPIFKTLMGGVVRKI